MNTPVVPFKPTGRNQHLTSGEVRRRSERATATGVSSLLCSSEFELWKNRKAQRRSAAWAAACLLLAILLYIWLYCRNLAALRPAAAPKDIAHVLGIIRGAGGPEGDITAAMGLVIALHKEVAAMRVQAANLMEDSNKLHSRLALSKASSAEHKRTAQQRQSELQRLKAAAAELQERSDAWQREAGSCSTLLARALEEVQVAEIATLSASQAASHHEKAAVGAVQRETVARDAHAECMASLTASQQELRLCAVELSRTRQKAGESSAIASECSRELLKVGGELEYVLTDSEALIRRTGAAHLRAAALAAAALSLGTLLTAAIMHSTNRKIVSLQLEREKLLLDKMEAESGCGSLRQSNGR